MDVWQDPLVELRLPKLFNLRSDPFERADEEAIGYGLWRFERLFLLVPAQVYVGQWLKTLAEFPPRQAPGSFSLSKVMAKLRAGASGGAKSFPTLLRVRPGSDTQLSPERRSCVSLPGRLGRVGQELGRQFAVAVRASDCARRTFCLPCGLRRRYLPVKALHDGCHQ